MPRTRFVPIALSLLAGPASGATTHFGFKQITIAGSTNVSAAALNNSSTIAGTFTDAGGPHGFIKAGANLTILPAPIANCGCVATPIAINASGDVVGSVYYVDLFGFLWHHGAYVQSASVTLGIGGGRDPVIGINKGGQEIFDTYSGSGNYTPFAGTPGNYTQLMPPGSFPFVDNINVHGVVAGQSSPLGPEVFIGSNGTYTELSPPGSVDSTQGFINDRGQVAGLYQDSSGVTHGFLYRSGVYKLYDFPHGPSAITIDAINNAGRVTGVYSDTVKKMKRAFLFNGTTLSVFGQYGVTDDVHVAINDAGAMLLSDFNASSGAASSYRVLCGGDGC